MALKANTYAISTLKNHTKFDVTNNYLASCIKLVRTGEKINQFKDWIKELGSP